MAYKSILKKIRIGLYVFIIITIVKSTEAETVFQLNSGHNIPIVGFGTHGFDEKLLEDILTSALDEGLRHIDTGFIYQNEKTIGRVLKRWFDKGGKREDIFITSKLPYFDNHPASVEKYLKLSLEQLGLEYLDMYLIHAPFGIVHKNNSYDLANNEDGSLVLDYDIDHTAIWREMEKQVENGRTLSIGLSNFNETQITNILKHAAIEPSNLQIEVTAYHQQKPLREFCKKHGIVVTAYAPLSSLRSRLGLHPDQKEEEFPDLLKHPLVSEIARKYGKSNVQILLRHIVQGGACVIPSSKNLDHLKLNLEIFDFELTDDEVQRMDTLDKGDRGKIFDYKHLKGIEKHPQYPFAR